MARAFECDICGEVVKGNPSSYKFSTVTIEGTDKKITGTLTIWGERGEYDSIDACDKCAKKMLEAFHEVGWQDYDEEKMIDEPMSDWVTIPSVFGVEEIQKDSSI